MTMKIESWWTYECGLCKATGKPAYNADSAAAALLEHLGKQCPAIHADNFDVLKTELIRVHAESWHRNVEVERLRTEAQRLRLTNENLEFKHRQLEERLKAKQ